MFTNVDTTAQTIGLQTQQPSKIHATLSLQFQYGDAIIISHLRADSNKMAKDAFARIDQAAAFAEALDRDPTVTNIYVNLQQLKPGSTTDKRQDVEQYTHFLVDIDRRHKKVDGVRVNASEEERASLRKAAEEVRGWVSGILEAYPRFADSGNGFHLCWDLQPSSFGPITPTEENQTTYKECLLAIGQRFDSELVEIDPSLSEPEQIIRLWGTHNRRDPETPGRPHRHSQLLENARGKVWISQLEILACEYEAPSRTESAAHGDAPPLHEDFDETSWWDHYSEVFTQDGEHDGWQVTSICPATYEGTDAPGHRHTGSTLTGVRFDRGTAEFHCFSDDHCDMSFGQLVKHLNQHYMPFPGRIWGRGDDDFSDFADVVDAEDGLPEVTPAVKPNGSDESYNKKGTPCSTCKKPSFAGLWTESAKTASISRRYEPTLKAPPLQSSRMTRWPSPRNASMGDWAS